MLSFQTCFERLLRRGGGERGTKVIMGLVEFMQVPTTVFT